MYGAMAVWLEQYARVILIAALSCTYMSVRVLSACALDARSACAFPGTAAQHMLRHNASLRTLIGWYILPTSFSGYVTVLREVRHDALFEANFLRSPVSNAWSRAQRPSPLP